MSLLRRGIISSGKLGAGGGPSTAFFDCLTFDGSNGNNVTATSPAHSGDFSAFIWVKKATAQQARALINTAGGFILNLETDGKIKAIYNGTTSFSSGADTGDFGWHLIGLCGDASTAEIYFDNVQVGSFSSGGNGNISGPTYFGSAVNGGQALDGSLGPCMTFSKKLITAERLEVWNGGKAAQPDFFSPSLKANYLQAYPFNDGVAGGTELDDQSVNGNDGTLNGTGVFTEPLEFTI